MRGTFRSHWVTGLLIVLSPATLAGLTIADSFVRWTDTDGTAYYVFSHTLDDGPALGQEGLFAVARSLDPAVPLPEP